MGIFTKKKKEIWVERARSGEKIVHLDKGDILIKKNFDFDLVSSVISLGQRIGQHFNSEGTGDGDWSSGHVALALDRLRLAEQTGEGLSINTLGVTSKEIAPHEVSLVYYDVWDCQDVNVKKTAADFAESFTYARPLMQVAQRPTENYFAPAARKSIQANIGGKYDLKRALPSVFGDHSVRQVGEIGENIDPWATNVYQYCCGVVRHRKDMFCSAFVVACYQAACAFLDATGQSIQGQQSRCILNVNSRWLTPRMYELKLEASQAYHLKGTYRYEDLDGTNEIKSVASRVFAHLSQADSTYANGITTGRFFDENKKVIEMIARKKKQLEDERAVREKKTKFLRALTRGIDARTVIQSLLTPFEKQAYERLHDSIQKCRQFQESPHFPAVVYALYHESFRKILDDLEVGELLKQESILKVVLEQFDDEIKKIGGFLLFHPLTPGLSSRSEEQKLDARKRNNRRGVKLP